MKSIPLQMVIIDLENGQRGVFIGTPLVTEDCEERECQVESVWFTEIHELPGGSTLEQLTKMALQQMRATGRQLQ